jgi:hypothetical protein
MTGIKKVRQGTDTRAKRVLLKVLQKAQQKK